MIYKLAEHKNEYLHLPILPSIQEQAWKQSQHHSHTIARHNSYINYLSLYTLIDWFRNEQSLAEPVIYPSAKSLSSIWEVVNGAGIKLGERQIVIIPCEISEFEEFSVPQEWVDIPEWVGDYYLAIQVNLEPEEDECWIEVCGFTTHSYLKNLGKYNFHDRTYAITVDNLIQDITVMEITLPLEMKAEIPELPHLSAVKAEELLQMFANSSIYSPRLRVNDITFEEWAALLVNDSWRQQLYEQRMGKLVTSSNLVSTNTTKAAQGISSKIDHIVAWITTTLENFCDLVQPIFEHDSEILIPEFKNAHLPIAYEGIKEINLVSPRGRQLIKVTKILEVVNDSELINILIDVSSTDFHTPLPPDLEIRVINKDNQNIYSIITEENDMNVRFPFSRQFGEPFSIKLMISGEDIEVFEYK